MTNEYQIEKENLNKIMYDFLVKNNTNSLGNYDFSYGRIPNNPIKLYYFGVLVDTYIDMIFINWEDEIIVENHIIDNVDDERYEADVFTHFSNDEMKMIMDLIGCEY